MVQGEALRKYGRDYERVASGSGSAINRLASLQALTAARSALTPGMRAVVDLCAGLGMSPEDVSRKAGVSVADVEDLLAQSSERIAPVYERLAA